MVTQTLGVYNRFLSKEKWCADRYRAACAAMLALEPTGTWMVTYKMLLDADLRGPRRDDNKVITSEGRYEISWIWFTPRSTREPSETTGGATSEEFVETMRAEWARSKAHADRWAEEEQLLLEGMRRILAYLKWKANWWRSQIERHTDVSSQLHRGLKVYAAKQVAVYEQLATWTASYWVSYLQKLGPLPAWIVPYQAAARRICPRSVMPSAEGVQEEESSDEEL